MSGHNSGKELYEAPLELADPGDGNAIVPKSSPCTVDLVSAGAETRTLGNPKRAGQLLHLNFRTDGGDITLTVSQAFNVAGNDTITFADVRDSVTLISERIASTGAATDFAYKIVGSDGVSLS